MRVYIAGPMSGLQDHNFPAFHAMARTLRAIGYDVVNPAEIVTDQSAPWDACLRADIRELVTCDCVALLPGWEKSRGARLEAHIASELGMIRFDAHVLASEALKTKTNPAALAGAPGLATATT